jgi:hypothetical protein
MAFRSKYQHTMRVLGWAKRLAEGRKDVDTDEDFNFSAVGLQLTIHSRY